MLRRSQKISDDYLKRVYGSAAGYFASKVNYVDACTVYGTLGFGKQFGDTHEEIQCEIIKGSGLDDIDPALLTYEQKVRRHLREFFCSTSAHGIPMIGGADNRASRVWWILLYLFCLANCLYQGSRVIDKYNKNEKIVDIQLVFEAAPFPSITMCNLNPYKRSAARSVELVQRTLRAFDNALGEAGGATMAKNGGHKLKKRAAGAIFERAFSDCSCSGTGAATNCVADVETEPDDKENMCLCAFDRHSGDAWPCYPRTVWSNAQCDTCDAHGYCNKALDELSGSMTPCYCQSVSAFCIADDGGIPLNLWEYYGKQHATEDPAFLEAMGFAGMTDEVAIVTKAKENIMFAMSTLSMEMRRNLSYAKKEFIQKCSFNGKQCNIDNDFQIRVDPIFGNCFTFNHNRSVNLTSIRAGPMYGLRLLVYVNATEYMPTTEATGVKLTIHEKDQYPFPDTFGYSAPTGSISSFGIKLKRIERLPAPYGDCVIDGKTAEFIYKDFEYSTEGCFRTCFQRLVLSECGCGDPRFPVSGDETHCQAIDPVARKCLDQRTRELGGLHGSFRCRCQQPCAQASFSLSYSASVWPSESLQVQLGTCEGTHVECIQHYRDHAAMVEVFFEQLNFEMLREFGAYGFVNLLSDFGGQLGLWLGLSIITCWEFVFFFVQWIWMTLRHQYEEYLKRQEETKKRH